MKARPVEGLDPAAPLRPNATRIVATRLAELLELADEALEPGATQAQHDMRIAAKRLRYALEIVAPCIGPAAADAREAAKALQGALGEMRDCDAMLIRVAGIESLETLLRTRRELRFQHFQELWRAQAQTGVWDSLDRTCRSLDTHTGR